MEKLKEFCRRNKVELLLYLCFFLFYFILTRGSITPLIYGDEAGYIGWARRILYGEQTGVPYMPGYSLLLLPVFALTNDITKAYPYLLLINSLLGGLIPVAAYRLTLLFAGSLAKWKVILVTLVVSLYPSFLLFGCMALSEVLMAVLFLLLAYSVHYLSHNPARPMAWLAVLFLTGYLALTHLRAFAILPVVLITMLVIAHKHIGKDKTKWIYAGIGVMAVIIAVCGVYVLMNSDNTNIEHIRNQLLSLLTERGIKDIIYVFIAQALYLVMATYGLIVIGFWYGWRYLRRKGEESVTVFFLLLSCLAMMCLSAIFMGHHQKPIHIIYGRYNEFVLLGVLLLGAVGLLKEKKLSKLIWVVPLFFAAVTIYKQSAPLSDPGSGRVDNQIAHIFGIYLYKAFLNYFNCLLVVLIFGVLAVLVYLVGRKRRCLSLVLVAFLFGSTALFARYDYLKNLIAERSPRTLMMDLLSEYKEEGVDIMESTRQDNGLSWSWDPTNYTVYYPKISVHKSGEGHPLLLTRQADWDLPLIEMERNNNTYLWAMNDEMAERYKDHLLPTQYPAVYEEYRSKVSLTRMDENGEITVKLENRGKGVGWLCFDSVQDIRSAVRLAVRIYGKDNRLTDEMRLDIPRNMFYGDACDLTFSLPVSDGEYLIYLEPVQDFNTWFTQQGDDGQLALVVNKSDGKTTLLQEMEGYEMADGRELFQRIDVSLLEHTQEYLYTPNTNNLVNFEGNHISPDGSVLAGLNSTVTSEDRLLVVKAVDGEPSGMELALQVGIDGTPLPFSHYEDGYYYFDLNGYKGNIHEIGLKSETYNPAKNAGVPQWLSFLSLNSNSKQVQYLVRMAKKHWNLDWDWHDYGIAVERIEIR